MHWSLNYREPAKAWTEALPLGNGELGAMVFGETEEERIELNLDTLWSGNGKKEQVYKETPDWNHMRHLIFHGKQKEAEKYAREHILGDWTTAYLPAGTLYINTKKEKTEVKEKYYRELTLEEAVHTASWESGNVFHKRETFISMKENVLAVRISVDPKQGMEAEIFLDSPLKYEISEGKDGGRLVLLGRAPTYAAPDYYECKDPIQYCDKEGIRFGLLVSVQLKSGILKREGNRLYVSTYDDFYIFLNGKTDFDGCSDLWGSLHTQAKKLEEKGYDTLKEEHIRLYKSIFDRMELQLGENNKEEKDTYQRLQEFKQGSKDYDLMALLFHYARYLMICSSKPGTQAANLQGIWNNKLRAPWSSNYTVNINTEMNYWMAESCNLSEFHEPLFDLIDRTVRNGKITAQRLYGLEGWVSHHNIDIWGHSDPVGKYAKDEYPCQYALWPMSSGWLCRHLWEHYVYTLDQEFLKKRAFPVIREAVRFYLGYLTEYQGYLLTCPSTSPENRYMDEEGEEHSVSFGSTMDLSILKELFENYIHICEITGEQELKAETEKALKKLPAFKIGREGQLQEWYEDYWETDVHHRHISHLYGLYPANVIKEEDTELRKACKRVLERRGDEGTGWSMIWKAALWARLKNGNRAIQLLKKQIRLTEEVEVSMTGGGIYPNLFCAHPPFQIDGNLGYAAAVTEMLLQTQENVIEFLPALPKDWKNGYVKGMKAKGGYTVDFAWKNCILTEFCIRAACPGEVVVKWNQELHHISIGEDREFIYKSGL